ncbi:MAG: hypothetical protein HDR26_09705 [Lachnospiraceae bacterium]|nr:hypothetical protein [Lachnospiraceae bacterium]
MKIMKLLFSSARNAVLSVLCAIVILAAVGAGIAFAVEAGTAREPMDRAAALRCALSDAGLTEDEITITKQKLDHDNGKSCYEIEFFTADYAYEYEIDASTGAVNEVSIEALFGMPTAESNVGVGGNAGTESNAGVGGNAEAEGNAGAESQEQPDAGQSGQQGGQSAGNQPAGNQPAGSQPAESQPVGNQPAGSQITLDAAKSAALSDAGVSAADAVFTKVKSDWDDGIVVYEIEFYTSAGEYEYKLDAATGAILDREVKMYQSDSPAQASASGNGSSYIGVEQAKEIAAGHAGYAVSSVVFTKAKLEREDGISEYEIEFYIDCVEYEYSIDAFTGAVLDYECESDHYQGCPHSNHDNHDSHHDSHH